MCRFFVMQIANIMFTVCIRSYVCYMSPKSRQRQIDREITNYTDALCVYTNFTYHFSTEYRQLCVQR